MAWCEQCILCNWGRVLRKISNLDSSRWLSAIFGKGDSFLVLWANDWLNPDANRYDVGIRSLGWWAFSFGYDSPNDDVIEHLCFCLLLQMVADAWMMMAMLYRLSIGFFKQKALCVASVDAVTDVISWWLQQMMWNICRCFCDCLWSIFLLVSAMWCLLLHRRVTSRQIHSRFVRWCGRMNGVCLNQFEIGQIG